MYGVRCNVVCRWFVPRTLPPAVQATDADAAGERDTAGLHAALSGERRGPGDLRDVQGEGVGVSAWA